VGGLLPLTKQRYCAGQHPPPPPMGPLRAAPTTAAAAAAAWSAAPLLPHRHGSVGAEWPVAPRGGCAPRDRHIGGPVAAAAIHRPDSRRLSAAAFLYGAACRRSYGFTFGAPRGRLGGECIYGG
jgi:hypothetical protein